MGQDRLAALRAQRQAPAPAPAPAPDADSYELQPPANGAGTAADDAFFSEATATQESVLQFDANVTRIADLHSRFLNTLDADEANRITAQLSDLTDETRQLSNTLANRVRSLARPTAPVQHAKIRENRTELVRKKFIATLQRYQDVERQYRQQYDQRVVRRIKIVKPDATADDVAAILNDDQGTGDRIFMEALKSARHDESEVAYREVQERHQGIRRIEQTLAEVAQLFNDMDNLIVVQEDKIDAMQTQAAVVSHDAEEGAKHTSEAQRLARAARRKRWICFWLTVVVVLAAVGIGVGVYYGVHPPNSTTSSNSTSTR